MKSTQQHVFSQVPKAEILRSSFDRSHGVKTTFDAGKLYPFFVDEALPGDTFNLRTSGFARLSTPIYPIMDNMYLDTFYFAVPLRIIWENFQKMMGEQDSPSDPTDYLIPTAVSPAGGYEEDSLYDYMGIPTKVENLEHSALFFRAYNLIWNQWFRDQNLQDSQPVAQGDGPDSFGSYNIQSRGKRHDYFTSSLPWPQKGESIDLPLGSVAPVIPRDNGFGTIGPSFQAVGATNPGQLTTTGTTGEEGNVFQTPVPDVPGGLMWWDSGLEADLTNATAATINQLRQAFQIQKMYERDARGGTRYTEIIKAHFNVTSPDSRLQRPEYLGGGTTPVNITPITATADIAAVGGAAGSELGRLSAVGTASFQGHGFTKSFTEHTIIIGLLNVRADLTYQQGLNRMFSRSDRLDFYWPALAQIGEQEVLQKEIFASGVPAEDDLVFGYQERYAEYRYKPSTIHGRFRSNSTAPLDAWHLAQDFADAPLLSDAFIKDNPPIDRVVAVPTEPQFIADFYHKLTTARPMPLYGVPGNMDRF